MRFDASLWIIGYLFTNGFATEIIEKPLPWHVVFYWPVIAGKMVASYLLGL